ncbi:MAG: hypothetical protein WCX28_07825 [Bacteriovoracaceae bacterium]
MNTPKTNSTRRSFFRKAGAAAIGAGLLSAIPVKLVSRTKEEKHPEQNISITINPMAVKREKRK